MTLSLLAVPAKFGGPSPEPVINTDNLCEYRPPLNNVRESEMVDGVAKSVTKIVMISVLILVALVLLITVVTITISVTDRDSAANYVDMNAGSVSSRQVKIGPGKYHLKRIRSGRMAFIEVGYVKGTATEICIRKSSSVVSNTIVKSTCEHFYVLEKDSSDSAKFALGRGAFDLFISNKARFRSAHVTYSVDVRQ